MIYITSTLKSSAGAGMNFYRGFDTSTDSQIVVGKSILKCIILGTKIQVVNASIQKGNIVIKDWGNGLTYEENNIQGFKIKIDYSGPKYILFARGNNVNKLIDCEGHVSTPWETDLINMVKSGKVANCRIIDTGNGDKLIAEDFYEIQEDKEFEKLIESKYSSFVAKTAMLGYSGITFEYAIENHEVELTRYTGSNKDIILPSFITTIGKTAFEAIGISTVKLNEGLHIIGEGAFAFNEIERIEIPETVELIGWGAFSHNSKLIRNASELNTDRFKFRNTKTIMLDQIN